jgi:glycosyltransferase involved in cell wall biosynthesis
MTVTNSSRPKASVIIPVYNAENFLQRCLDSVWEQTLTDYEVIVVDDGSSDASLSILQKNAEQHSNLLIIKQANHGQGYARNRALERAKGHYVLFLDADDWLDKSALLTLTGSTDDDAVDVVHGGWKAGNSGAIAHKQNYLPQEIFSSDQLAGEECDEFLRLPNYFSIGNLFRRKFLINQHIKFGEGYFYEDNEFMVAVANRAQSIRFINQELYIINFHGASSTRGNFTTNRHSQDFIRAIAQSYISLQPRLKQSSTYLANYFLEKFVIYYQYRVPNRYKRSFRREFIDIMSKQTIPKEVVSVSKFLRLCVRLDVFSHRRYILFWICLIYKTHILPLLKH